ncbi:hypothetical protein K2173_013005 [Erythroxylum novogranatense]|uniref:Uncharacterized protein n=1 Tax=Erythroxylum novogranatense TaxID=1862640 RepID=A0AAV8S6Y1_9ROSI|nr:hypothetical protein K2173_013005 [Erythroxylum novogranatense]
MTGALAWQVKILNKKYFFGVLRRRWHGVLFIPPALLLVCVCVVSLLFFFRSPLFPYTSAPIAGPVHWMDYKHPILTLGVKWITYVDQE